MRISIKEAEGQLTELVKLANRGEEVVLMQDGLPSVRLQPVAATTTGVSDFDAALAEVRKQQTPASKRKPLSAAEKRKLIDDIRAMAPSWKAGEPTADRSHDFLYGEDGLPK